MGNVINLSKGYDINMSGKAAMELADAPMPKTFAIKPQEFRNRKFKLELKVGAEVKAGTAILFEKNNPEIKLTSPVSGEIVEIRRGAKRVIEEVVILADSSISYVNFTQADPESLSKDEILKNIMASGLFAGIRQRPFDVIPNPTIEPKAIHISCFDSAPLAVETQFVVEKDRTAFEYGVKALKKLTSGQVHLNVHASKTFHDSFLKAKGVQVNSFEGAHPAGSVGVQMHHTTPVGKNDIVWYVNPQEVIAIGRLFRDGKYDARKIIATAGTEFKTKKYWNAWYNMCVDVFSADLSKEQEVRLISGNVLTGTQINPEKGYMNFYSNLLTAIPEGNDMEFMGWLIPSYSRPDISKTFHWSFMGNKIEHNVNTNMHGEQRAFVVSGQYEEVLPMDLYPVFLLKSIIYNDMDEMEELGIYEVGVEDIALCEFVCTSKIPVQQILQQGIDTMMVELG